MERPPLAREYTIRTLLGGMMRPVVAALTLTAVVNPFEYPSARMRGSMRLPTADALATAFFVMGIEQARQYVQDHPEVRAVLICPGGRAGATDVHLVGLAPGSWKLLSEAVTLVDHGHAPGC